MNFVFQLKWPETKLILVSFVTGLGRSAELVAYLKVCFRYGDLSLLSGSLMGV